MTTIAAPAPAAVPGPTTTGSGVERGSAGRPDGFQRELDRAMERSPGEHGKDSRDPARSDGRGDRVERPAHRHARDEADMNDPGDDVTAGPVDGATEPTEGSPDAAEGGTDAAEGDETPDAPIAPDTTAPAPAPAVEQAAPTPVATAPTPTAPAAGAAASATTQAAEGTAGTAAATTTATPLEAATAEPTDATEPSGATPTTAQGVDGEVAPPATSTTTDAEATATDPAAGSTGATGATVQATAPRVDDAPTRAVEDPAAAAPTATVDTAAAPAAVAATVAATEEGGTTVTTTDARGAAPVDAHGAATAQPTARPVDTGAAQAPNAPLPDVRADHADQVLRTEELAESLRASFRRGETSSSLSIQLHPAELGAVRIEARLVDGVTHLVLRAESGAAVERLSVAMEQLRHDLANGGVDVGDLELRQGTQQRDGSRGDSTGPRTHPHDDARGTAAATTTRPSAVPVTGGGSVAIDL